MLHNKRNLSALFSSVIFLFILSFIPLIASAHIKWFAEEGAPVRPYQFTDWQVVAGIVGVCAMIGIGIFLEKKLSVPHWLLRSLEKVAPYVLSLASIGFGLAFLIFAYKGFVFAPNLEVYPHTNMLIILEALAGAMIFLGFYERVGGLLLLVLFGLMVKEHGTIEMLDTLEMVGFALYAIIVGRPKWKIKDTALFQKFTHPLHAYGLPLLRVGTGLNLLILGFSEKILSPSLTQNFLSVYHWNFMETLGFSHFSNYWFAFFAGVAEALFGIFFILGLVTRTTTVALALFLITTLALLGPIELVGHLPHFSIAIVLLVLGAGSRLRLVRNKE